MNNKKAMYIAANLLAFLSSITSFIELYFEGESINTIILAFIVILVIVNFLIFIFGFLSDLVLRWYESRSIKKKYNLYEWLGAPQHPINLYAEFSNIKNFDRNDFKNNCILIKEKIKRETKDINGLREYQSYLKLKNNSPKLKSLLNSFQSIIIAVVTSCLVTLLNFTKVKPSILPIYFFLFLVFMVILIKLIDHSSKKMDRNELLLLLVNECIYEDENKKSS